MNALASRNQLLADQIEDYNDKFNTNANLRLQRRNSIGHAPDEDIPMYFPELAQHAQEQVKPTQREEPQTTFMTQPENKSVLGQYRRPSTENLAAEMEQ